MELEMEMNFRIGMTAWIGIRSTVRRIAGSLATALFVLGFDATDLYTALGLGNPV